MNTLKKTAYILIMCIVFGSSAAMAQMKWNSAYKAYVDQYKDLAIEHVDDLIDALDEALTYVK